MLGKFKTGILLSADLRASPRFVILSGEKCRMRDNECQNSCDLSRRISAKPPPSFLIPNLSKAFISDQGTIRPLDFPRTPNPEP